MVYMVRPPNPLPDAEPVNRDDIMMTPVAKVISEKTPLTSDRKTRIRSKNTVSRISYASSTKSNNTSKDSVSRNTLYDNSLRHVSSANALERARRTQMNRRGANINTLSFYYGDQPYACIQDERCMMRFATKEYQAAHHTRVHGTRAPYICTSYIKSNRVARFTTKEEMIKHKLDPHIGFVNSQKIIEDKEKQDKLVVMSKKKLQSRFCMSV